MKRDFWRRSTPSRLWSCRQHQAQQQIVSLGIDRSSDARVLFERFTKRLALTETRKIWRAPRTVPRIAKTNGGTPHELAFVLLHLFEWNDIVAEPVEVYNESVAGRNGEFTYDNCEHHLVYAPAIEQYFDPTLRIAQQLKEAGATWVAERPRIHYSCSGVVGDGYYGEAFHRMLKDRRRQQS